MQKKTTIASLAAALILGTAMSANAQTDAISAASQTQNASAPQTKDFVDTRRVLAKSNLCDWYRSGGIAWDYAGPQTYADWTAATQAVTGDLRAMNPGLAGDRLMREVEQRITDLCRQQVTHTAGSI